MELIVLGLVFIEYYIASNFINFRLYETNVIIMVALLVYGANIFFFGIFGLEQRYSLSKKHLERMSFMILAFIVFVVIIAYASSKWPSTDQLIEIVSLTAFTQGNNLILPYLGFIMFRVYMHLVLLLSLKLGHFVYLGFVKLGVMELKDTEPKTKASEENAPLFLDI